MDGNTKDEQHPSNADGLRALVVLRGVVEIIPDELGNGEQSLRKPGM